MKRGKRCKKPKDLAQAKQPADAGLRKIRPLVAGIDVGSEQHFVCAPTSDGGTEIRVFGGTTPDLQALLEWLQESHVESVAMESTGVYWIPLYELLASHGIEVLLTDTRHFSRVPGRKTDAQDCQWIRLPVGFAYRSAARFPAGNRQSAPSSCRTSLTPALN